MSVHVFGMIGDAPVMEIEIRSKAGARAKILTWGAVLRDLTIPMREGPQQVTLGFDRLDHYLQHSPSFGCVPGRFANRIANGAFELDGMRYALERGGAKHILHGGPNGFGRRIWKLIEADVNSVALELESPDGDAGFPGALKASCVYRFVEPATLRVELGAVAETTTIVNLTQHAYFNLDGSPDILDHELQLDCDFYTPVDAELIPTGEIRAVAGTPFDFRRARPIRNAAGQSYDINFVAARTPGPDGMARVATLRSPKNGLSLDLHSSEPGVQIYDAAALNVPVPGLNGAHYGAYAGLAMEPQVFPDSPNRRHFPPCVLRPDEEYRHVSEFRFRV